VFIKAGTWGLGKLCGRFGMIIALSSMMAIVEGGLLIIPPARLKPIGWHVIADVDGHDPQAIAAAI